MKFKIIQLDVILLCLTFYEITLFTHSFYLTYKYIVLSYLFIKYIPTFFKLKQVMIPTALYGAVNVISSIINHMSDNQIISSFFFAIQVMVIFLLCDRFLAKNDVIDLARIVFVLFFIILMINDAMFLFKDYRFYYPSEVYFVGNKFIVSYLHCFTSALAFLLCSKTEKMFTVTEGKLRFEAMPTKIFAFGFSVFSLLICRQVTCSTGVIACAMLITTMILPYFIKKVISREKIIIIFTAAINFVLIGCYALVNNSFLHDIIYGYFEKSATWTGRLAIWEIILTKNRF